MESSENIEALDSEKRQSLMDCYRIALDFGLAAGNLAAEQVRLQRSDLPMETTYSST